MLVIQELPKIVYKVFHDDSCTDEDLLDKMTESICHFVVEQALKDEESDSDISQAQINLPNSV